MKKKLANALEDLDQAFENLEVKPLSDNEVGRVAGAFDTSPAECYTHYPGGPTCNSKCGATAYWECGPTGGTCNTGDPWGCACV